MILPGGAGFNIARNVDVTGCTDQENCPRCLGSEAWQTKLINEVGLYSANRDPSFQPWVGVDEWLSAGIVSAITMLLLRDTMNISARAASMAMAGNIAFICCMDPLITMEQWTSSGTFLDDSTQHTTTGAANGYTGQSGLFVFPHTLEKYPLAFTYQAYRLLPDYQHIFPPSFSTACSNMTVNATKGCVSGNYVCERNLWTNTTCYDGQWYVPPQCNIPGEVGNSSATRCQEVIMADPQYDGGYIEGMIKNNRLNMTGAYVGLDRHGTIVRDKVARKEDFIFYWYIPDPLVAQVGGKMIDFPEVTAACAAASRADPTRNNVTCGFPSLSLEKRVRTDALARDVDFKYFFDKFMISDAQINDLLLQHKTAGGNYSVYDLSCNWLKNNFDTWKGMVRNTPPTAQLAVSSSNALDNPGVVAAFVIAPVLLVGAVVGGLLWMCCKHRLSLKYAPRTAPLAMVFTDIENSTMLWETCGDDMGTAVEIHHAIIRKHIEEYGAYEVKTIGDCFMIACNSLGDATMMCLSIQTSLGECKDFPPRLQYRQPEFDVKSKSIASSVRLFDTADDGFMESLGSAPTTASPQYSRQSSAVGQSEVNMRNGEFHYPLRVRIGLHWCQEINPRMDAVHGRYDYYGHDVNVCARVEAQAQGGQIMVTAETMDAIMDTDEYPLMIAPDVVSGIVKRDVVLKGVSEKVNLFAMAPISQVSSGYVASKMLMESSRAMRSSSRGSIALPSSASSITDTVNTTRSTANVKLSVNYATALLRATFKAVPDPAKGPWLVSLSKILRAKTDGRVSSDKQEQSRQFDILRAAVKENCSQSISASQSAGGETDSYNLSALQDLPTGSLRKSVVESQDGGPANE